MNYNKVSKRISVYLNIEVQEIVKVEEWTNCYYVQVRGQRPTFISKNITLPVIPLWALHQLHTGLSWQRNDVIRYIKERTEHHKSIVELCDWYGWSLDLDEYGWRIEGHYTSVYYQGLEQEIADRLADVPTQIEYAIAA